MQGKSEEYRNTTKMQEQDALLLFEAIAVNVVFLEKVW